MPPSDTYRAPWEKTWPKESTAYIRVDPRPDPELEDDESVSCYTYIYEDRVVHIWEASDYDYPEQEEEEDEIARAKVIWERLNPAADWFYCHTDGTRIGDGEAIPHHAHIIIGLRDEVDPDWYSKAKKESISPPSHCLDEDSDYSNPEVAQPECLAPARLAQPGATAQIDGDKCYVIKGRNAFIRVVPRAESTLDGDESCYAVTCVHGEREITIWESYVFDFPDQWKSDMEIRNRVINECSGFLGNFAYRQLDGSESEVGSTLPHRSRILIVPIPDPEPVQPECLAPARLDQPGVTAQVDDGKDAHQDSEDSRGKSVGCTANESPLKFFIGGLTCCYLPAQSFREVLEDQDIAIKGEFLFERDGTSCYCIEDQFEDDRVSLNGVHLIWEEDLGGTQTGIQAEYLANLSPKLLASLEIISQND
jgi:hypothetical protein